ncbi:MAG: Hsp20/alpha crystallin family protein, partial [Rhodoferax sp.]|nr:Hsp20/alpha crystallin family protein [Rhodoferax sp.]
RVEGDQLSIEAETVLPVPQGMDATHVEVGLSRYRRAFTLSKELDAEKVSAEMSHGVLRVRIPKAAHAQPRRIAVQVA